MVKLPCAPTRRWTVVGLLWLIVGPTFGCHAFRTGWLDPTALGDFEYTGTTDIRASLTLDESPRRIPGTTYPGPEDFEFIAEDYPISPGDTLAIEIYELRERLVPYQLQAQVSSTGYLNLPVVGRVHATDLSIPQLEAALVNTLREREILLDPQVTVSPVFLHSATYSIFGIGVSAAVNAPLRAGTFPIRRPDLRILEAINQVGGLNEFVTEVFIFRSYTRRDEADRAEVELGDASDGGGDSSASVGSGEHSVEPGEREHGTEREGLSPRDELIRAVVEHGEGGPAQPAPSEPVEVPELLEPEPSDPFIWVDGAFVANPRYRARAREDLEATPFTASESPVPTVNWARWSGDSTHRILQIRADLLRTGDPEANIYVRPGDVIRIVSGEIGVYYVMGQVIRVGTYRFNAEEITLKAAIAAAGGLADLAWPDRCTIYRRLGRREQMIQVNLDRIFAGLDSDFQIRRGDIINVGTHPFAPFLQRIRSLTLPNPVANIGYSFTYARNFADIDSFAVQANPRTRRDIEEANRFPDLFP